MDNAFKSHKIDDKSFISYIKRSIHNDVSACKGFSSQQAGEIDIIISEMTSNIVKHAGASGELLYRIQQSDSEAVFEVLCIDGGRGIADPHRMMKDGVSTTNTLGQGLGAMMRLSSFFQLYSLPEWGTILYAFVSSAHQPGSPKPRNGVDVHALCTNKPKEVVCGDGYFLKRHNDTISIFLGDGLGHGQHANEAVERAATVFDETDTNDPVEVLRAMHEKVRKTRGLVATVAVLDIVGRTWRICGVGNISTRLYTGIAYKNYLSYNGAVGLTMPNSLKESVLPVEKNQLLIMTSDGIRSRWDLAKYPAILKYDPRIMSATIYKDFNRGTDDASVLVAKVV